MNHTIHPFHDKVHLVEPTLKVRDLRACLSFYEEILGFKILARDSHRAELSATGLEPALLILEEDKLAKPWEPQQSGLFHLAYLYPSRADLGDILRRLESYKYRLQGASDHGVSEALYLADPEGNGLELYVDREESVWPFFQKSLQMTVDPFDFEGVYQAGSWKPGAEYTMPKDTILGHVHLQVVKLEVWEKFFTKVLKMDLMQRMPQADFLSYDRYHHHIAANHWRSRIQRASDSAGLQSFVIAIELSRLDSILQSECTDYVPTVVEGATSRFDYVAYHIEGIEVRLAAYDLDDSEP